LRDDFVLSVLENVVVVAGGLIQSVEGKRCRGCGCGQSYSRQNQQTGNLIDALNRLPGLDFPVYVIATPYLCYLGFDLQKLRRGRDCRCLRVLAGRGAAYCCDTIEGDCGIVVILAHACCLKTNRERAGFGEVVT